MAKTIRLLATYNGFKRGDIITLDDATADKLLLGGVSATLDLTGGTTAYQQSPGTGLSSGSNLPPNQTILAGQTTDIPVPSGVTLGLQGSADIAGTWSIVNPDDTTAGSTPLSPGLTVAGVFIVDTKVRFSVTFGTLTVKPGVVAGSAEGVPISTTSSTLLVGEDAKLSAFANIEAANNPVQVKRIPTATAGTFANNGNVNLSVSGAAGGAGDYLRSAEVEVKAGGRSSIFITQNNDAIFGSGVAGSAVAAGTAVTLTSGPVLAATANQLADRAVSIFYAPTGESAQWFTSRIVSHAAISTTSIALVLEDALPAGAAPTAWTIHGPQARRLMEANRAEGKYQLDIKRKSATGGFVAWVGSGIISADFYGIFTN